jgi:TRAP-type C4-dicarboxylate transport system permease small subunit
MAFVDRTSYWGVVVALGMMTVLVTAQVITRYVFNSSIDSADELSRLFFVWSIFLAIPHGVKFGTHVGIDLLVSRLAEAKRELVFRGVSAMGALLMAVVFYAALIATIDKWPELMPTLNFTAAVYYIPVLICAGHSILHLLLQTSSGQMAIERDEF